MKADDFIPWTDRQGRYSPLRAAACAAALLPAAWIGAVLYTDRLAAKPIEQATHLTGTWALYFLLATLAVTPLKGLLAWPRLAAVRRLLGVTAFAYLAAHLALYVWDQDGNLTKVAGEIATRVYLTIGFVALFGFALLAATSFDAAMRRLKRKWKRLHQAVYPLTALGLLHFFMQAKSDVSEAVLLSGLFIALLLHRVPWPSSQRVPAALRIAVIAAAAGLAAAALEYAWYAGATGLPAARIFASNFDLAAQFDYQVRPLWRVMMIAAAPLPVLLWRSALQRSRTTGGLRPSAPSRPR